MKKKKKNLSIFTMSLSHSLEWTLNPTSVVQVSLHLYIKRANTKQQISKIWKGQTEQFNATELKEVNKIIYLEKYHFAVQTIITVCVNQPMYCFFFLFFFSPCVLSCVSYILKWKNVLFFPKFHYKSIFILKWNSGELFSQPYDLW